MVTVEVMFLDLYCFYFSTQLRHTSVKEFLNLEDSPLLRGHCHDVTERQVLFNMRFSTSLS
jgi:hypothetical protein